MKLYWKNSTNWSTFALPVLLRFDRLDRWWRRTRKLSSLTHQWLKSFKIGDPFSGSNSFHQPNMGLRLSVLIVCELRGSSTAISINVIIFAAECARTPRDCWSIGSFIGVLGWIGLVFLFKRYLGCTEVSFGIPSNSIHLEYWAGFSFTSILETCNTD